MSQNPSIIYTVIVRGAHVVLSEYSTATGNYIQFVKTIVAKIGTSNAKKSFDYGQYEFHLLAENNFTFLIMSDKGFKMRIAFAALEDLKTSFFQLFPQSTREAAISYGLNEQFSKVQKQKVEQYNSPSADKLAQIKINVEETKGVMMENLDKLLERGDKIDILVEKTAVMVTISTDMKQQASTIRRQMWWRNKKITIILVLVFLLALYFLLVAICGFSFKKC